MPVGKVSFHLGNDDSDKEEDEPDGVPLSPLSRLPMGSIMVVIHTGLSALGSRPCSRYQRNATNRIDLSSMI